MQCLVECVLHISGGQLLQCRVYYLVCYGVVHYVVKCRCNRYAWYTEDPNCTGSAFYFQCVVRR
jgi:hypothetical protein